MDPSAATPAAPAEWSVERLVRERHTSASTPGHRADPCRLALLIEGGSSRSAYSSGMVVAVEELGLTPVFDAVYGVSGGALNGAWLLCGRAGAVMDTWWNREIMRGIIAPRRALRGQPVVDTDYLVNTVYVDLVPMDFGAVLANPTTFHPIATATDTGESVDLHHLIDNELALRQALRASTGMPVLAGPPIELGGRHFIDGGLTELVAIRTALAQGATHAVVLRTRRPGELLSPPNRVEHHLVRRYLHRHAPGAMAAWHSRYAVAMDEERLLAEHPQVRQIRPAAHA
ncbi:MAG: patatin-like phospholipase family protein, partial [Candidatus Phosphoribacter sp.]